MLWLCLHFPSLPLAALSSAAASPWVITEGHGRTQVLLCNRQAAAAGIKPGMTLASARALASNLSTVARDRDAEERLRITVATLASRYSPTVSLALPDAVLLDIAGTERLFGGRLKLTRGVLRRLWRHDIPVRAAIAPTARGAWLLARTGKAHCVPHLHALTLLLDALAIDALPGVALPTATLQSLGIHTLGALRTLPRAGLARRLGEPLLLELDRTYGVTPDPLPPFAPPPAFSEALELPAPVADVSQLQFVAMRLIQSLCRFLRVQGWGVTRIVLTFRHEDVVPTQVEIGVSLTRDENHLGRVMRERLQRLALPAVAHGMALASGECAPLAHQQAALLPGEGALPGSADVLDQLRARLGEDRVFSCHLNADHRPERASRLAPAGAFAAAASAITAPRPLWLLREARRLSGTPRAAGYSLLSGPERIEAGWWDGHPVSRDYFTAWSAEGALCWLYRTRQGEWFVHGLFA
jgi:protein ImuB